MICTWTWIWLAVDAPGGGTQDVSISKWTGKESQQRLSFPYARYEASAGAKEETVFCVSSDGFLKVFH